LVKGGEIKGALGTYWYMGNCKHCRGGIDLNPRESRIMKENVCKGIFTLHAPLLMRKKVLKYI